MIEVLFNPAGCQNDRNAEIARIIIADIKEMLNIIVAWKIPAKRSKVCAEMCESLNLFSLEVCIGICYCLYHPTLASDNPGREENFFCQPSHWGDVGRPVMKLQYSSNSSQFTSCQFLLVLPWSQAPGWINLSYFLRNEIKHMETHIWDFSFRLNIRN